MIPGGGSVAAWMTGSSAASPVSHRSVSGGHQRTEPGSQDMSTAGTPASSPLVSAASSSGVGTSRCATNIRARASCSAMPGSSRFSSGRTYRRNTARRVPPSGVATVSWWTAEAMPPRSARAAVTVPPSAEPAQSSARRGGRDRSSRRVSASSSNPYGTSSAPTVTSRPARAQTRDITGFGGTDRANRPPKQPEVMIRRHDHRTGAANGGLGAGCGGVAAGDGFGDAAAGGVVGGGAQRYVGAGRGGERGPETPAADGGHGRGVPRLAAVERRLNARAGDSGGLGQLEMPGGDRQRLAAGGSGPVERHPADLVPQRQQRVRLVASRDPAELGSGDQEERARRSRRCRPGPGRRGRRRPGTERGRPPGAERGSGRR